MGKKAIQIVASVALIAGSLGYLLSTSMSEEMEYFHPADAVMEKQAELAGTRMRMGGHVLEGSIAQKPGTLEYTFQVKPVPEMMKYPAHANKSMRVFYTGVVPDTFKDDGKAQVVVTGELGKDGVFYAKDLLAKCPSKYEAEEKNKGTY